MFGWLSSSSAKKASRPQPTARLGLERLETRDTPSTLTMSATYGLGHNVTLSGNLSGTSTPANQTICITGVASGMAETDANGNFSVTIQANTLGEVDAQTMDGASNVASVTLTDTAPKCFNFGGVPEGNNMWVFSGTVTWTHPFQSMQAQIQGPPPVGVVPVGVTSNGTDEQRDLHGDVQRLHPAERTIVRRRQLRRHGHRRLGHTVQRRRRFRLPGKPMIGTGRRTRRTIPT